MKKTYISPESNEIVLSSIPLLNPTSVDPTQAGGGTDALAPSLPDFSDDEFFQLYIIK